MKYFKRSYDTFLLFGLIFLLISILSSDKGSLDIHMHDTYFVIALGHIYLILALIILFLWFLYKLLDSFMYSINLTRIHVAVTLLLYIILAVMLFVNFSKSLVQNGLPRRYTDFSEWNSFQNSFNLYGRETRFLLIIFVLLLFGQVIFPINVSIGVIKRHIRKNIG